MKIFFYKSLIIFILFILSFHFSVGLLKKEIKNEFYKFTSEESVQNLKNKIREEIKNSINKEKIISSDDAEILNIFINKLKKDLQ